VEWGQDRGKRIKDRRLKGPVGLRRMVGCGLRRGKRQGLCGARLRVNGRVGWRNGRMPVGAGAKSGWAVRGEA